MDAHIGFVANLCKKFKFDIPDAETTASLIHVGVSRDILDRHLPRAILDIELTVYLTDMSTFDEMNPADMEVLDSDAPAGITVECLELAIGAAVEIDCVAYRAAPG